MRRHSLLISAGILTAVATAFGGSGCSSSSTNNSSGGGSGGTADAGPTDATSNVDANVPTGQLEIACADLPASIYADPGALPATNGTIIHCTKDPDIAQADLEAAARAAEPASGGSEDAGAEDAGAGTPGYSGKAFTSGAHVYRVLYRTERGDDAGTPGYSSAIVYIPITPRATQLPVIVASHGSRGQAGKCAPSLNDVSDADVEYDFVHQMYPLVGLGFAVIAPDLAGYANYGGTNNPPSAYQSVADVGKSTLDGARALRNMIPHSLTDDVVLVGHSQGGGTALGALALYDSYGAGGTLKAVAVYSPLWLSPRANGAIFEVPDDYPIATSGIPKVLFWYAYTHGELLDGKGHGVDPFVADKQAAVTAFVNNDCWDAPDAPALGTLATDVFDPTFVMAVTSPAANYAPCSTDPTLNAICTKWIARFDADRPHITGTAATIPVLDLYGGEDTTIPPDFAACIFDRLGPGPSGGPVGDNLPLSVCYVPDATHGGVVAQKADYVSDWIASKTLGTADPGACPQTLANFVDAMGNPIACNPLIPNN
jgi:pimeloyl-ACP methyl ester carboxylesterase